MARALAALLALTVLAGCADPVWAPDAEVARVSYRHDGPPRLTLLTMINNSSGNGAHSALMINASERVIFDPSGSFFHPAIPERNDVLFGVTPQVADVYIRYHARQTYHVVRQDIDVSPEVAEAVLARVKAYGAVRNGWCTKATADVLVGLPGFEEMRSYFFPNRLLEHWAGLPGVSTEAIFENDADDKSRALEGVVFAPPQG